MANFRSGYLEQGSPLGNLRTSVMLSADNTVINTSGVSYLAISSDNTTASNRTFTLTSSTLDGQVLVLVLESGSSTTCQLANSGNVSLVAAWEPSQYGSLTLMWDHSASKWVELSRSPESVGTPADGSVTLAKLASAVAPSHIVKYAAQVTSVGGNAAEAFTVTGLAATDLVFCQVKDNGTNNVTILQAVPTTNTLTVTFSGDPGADTVIYYQALRATS